MKLIIILLTILTILFGIYIYPTLPTEVPSHWNTAGQVDGYVSQFWGAFLLPIILIGVNLLFLLIPKIDPKKENFKKFEKYYLGFILLFNVYFIYIYGLTIAWTLGKRFDMGQMITPAIGILFFYTGYLLLKAKPNWFVGIRTPWTLSNEKVWNETHQIGGRLFQVSGLIALLGFVFPMYAFWFVLVPVIGSTIFLFVYSYIKYKNKHH